MAGGYEVVLIEDIYGQLSGLERVVAGRVHPLAVDVIGRKSIWVAAVVHGREQAIAYPQVACQTVQMLLVPICWKQDGLQETFQLQGLRYRWTIRLALPKITAGQSGTEMFHEVRGLSLERALVLTVGPCQRSLISDAPGRGAEALVPHPTPPNTTRGDPSAYFQ